MRIPATHQHRTWLHCHMPRVCLSVRRCHCGYKIDFTICNDVGNDDKWSSNLSLLLWLPATYITVPMVWPIMHVLYDPENRHNGKIWIDLLVYSFIFKEPKIFQQASLMFIIILMRSKSSQRRRKRREDGKSKHNNNLYSSFFPSSPFLSF